MEDIEAEEEEEEEEAEKEEEDDVFVFEISSFEWVKFEKTLFDSISLYCLFLFKEGLTEELRSFVFRSVGRSRKSEGGWGFGLEEKSLKIFF